ncbi:MAG: hypothetical protein IE891_01470 [Flavobacteriaceae bacterium]|nr:hypothetical protein [Flavobacteriaceae bacterium]
MKILKLVEFVRVLEGGATMPILIKAIDVEDKIKLYALKLFTKEHIKTNFSVAKEIFANEFARDFDLICPEYAIIRIDHEKLRIFCLKNNIPINVDELDEGYKFCSLFMEPNILFNPLTHLSFVNQYDIEKVFAFDFVTMNADRGGPRKKPNLLINNEDLILIDHELTFPFINGFGNFEINYFQSVYSFNSDLHIFRKYLADKRKKDNIFDEFIEYLRNCSVKKFEKLFDEMDTYNIKYGNRDLILGYVRWAVNNHAFIHKNLSKRISKNG